MLKLGEIKYVDPKKLKRNVANGKYFKIESRQYFDTLSADIKQRGILVPLVAKSDGTLLAGHNRLTIAELLKIKKVPVQYAEGTISKKQEVEYIIKDNLLRRHLSYDERVSLYKKVCKDFNKRILLPGKLGVSAAELAESTGLNPRTINYDLSREKFKRKKEINAALEIDVKNEREVAIFGKAVARMLNVAIVEKSATVEALLPLANTAVSRLEAIRQQKFKK